MIPIPLTKQTQDNNVKNENNINTHQQLNAEFQITEQHAWSKKCFYLFHYEQQQQEPDSASWSEVQVWWVAGGQQEVGLALDHGGKQHAKNGQKLEKENGEGDNKKW